MNWELLPDASDWPPRGADDRFQSSASPALLVHSLANRRPHRPAGRLVLPVGRSRLEHPVRVEVRSGRLLRSARPRLCERPPLPSDSAIATASSAAEPVGSFGGLVPEAAGYGALSRPLLSLFRRCAGRAALYSMAAHHRARPAPDICDVPAVLRGLSVFLRIAARCSGSLLGKARALAARHRAAGARCLPVGALPVEPG